MGNNKYKFNPFTGNLDMTVDAQGIEEDVQKDIEQHNTSETAHQDMRSDIQQLKETQVDWNQNDEAESDHVKNRTHYKYDEEDISVDLSNYIGSNGSFQYSLPYNGKLYDKVFNLTIGENCFSSIPEYSPDGLSGGGSWNGFAGYSFSQGIINLSGNISPISTEEGIEVRFSVTHKEYKKLDSNYLSNDSDCIYVDKANGRDENNGFKSTPVQTLRKALELSNSNGNKYIRFADNSINIENASANLPYAYVEGQALRIWLDKGQTLYLNSYYNVYAEFKVRGDGDVVAGSPVVPMGVDIDIDITGDATFNYPLYAGRTDTYKTLLGDTLRIRAGKITLYCTNAVNTVYDNPTYNYQVYTNNIDLNAEEVYFYGDTSMYQILPKLSIVAKKLINYSTVFNADEFQISVDKYENYSSPSSGGVFQIGTGWVVGSVDFISAISNVFIKTLKVYSNSCTLFAPNVYKQTHKYRLHLHVGTFDLTNLETTAGAYPVRLYNLSVPNFDISGVCEHIDFNNGTAAEIYPWDMVQNYQGTMSSDWSDTFQPRDEFVWLDRPDSIFDFYYQEDAPSGNNGRTPQHPCGNMTELYTVVSRFAPDRGSAPFIRLHVMNGGRNSDFLSGRPNTNITNVIKFSTEGSSSTATLYPEGIELDFGYWNYNKISPNIEIVGETEMMKVYVRNLQTNSFCKIHGFDCVFLEHCTLRNAQLSCVYAMTVCNSSLGYGGHAEIRAGNFNSYATGFGGITSIEADLIDYLDFQSKESSPFSFSCISHSNVNVCALRYNNEAPNYGFINISASGVANVIRFLRGGLLVNVEADTLWYLHGDSITGGRTNLKSSSLCVRHVGNYSIPVENADFYAMADNILWDNPFYIHNSHVALKANKELNCTLLDIASSSIVDIEASTAYISAQAQATNSSMSSSLNIRGNFVSLSAVSGNLSLRELTIDAAHLDLGTGLIYQCNIRANEYTGSIALSDWLASDEDTIDKLPVNIFKVGHIKKKTANDLPLVVVNRKNIGVNLIFDYDTATYNGVEVTNMSQIINAPSGLDNIMSSYSATTSEIDDIMN